MEGNLDMDDSKTKYLILVGEGMGDEAQEELDGKTPLEAARTPNMDRLASRGVLGLTETIAHTRSLGVMWLIWPSWVLTLITTIRGELPWKRPAWA